MENVVSPQIHPVCYNHKDRVSYVTCQRCGKPICPACQIPAFVGFQCSSCVQQAKKNVPKYKTTFGGVSRENSSIATYSLIGICFFVFITQFIPSLNVVQNFVYAPFITQHEPWRMITANFLHSQSFLLHIFLNMYILFIVGRDLEKILGRLRFVSLYLISGFGGSVSVLLFAQTNTTSWFTPVLGASGSVFGLFGALYIIQRKFNRDVKQISVLILINLVLGFIIPGISWEAHLGGLLAGAALAEVLTRQPKTNQNLLHFSGSLAVVIFLIFLTLLKINLF